MQYKLIIFTAFILIHAQEAVLAHYDLDGNLISDEVTELNEMNMSTESSYNYENVQSEEIFQPQQNSDGVIVKEDVSFDQSPDNSIIADQSDNISNNEVITDVNDIMSQGNQELTQEPVNQSNELVINEQPSQNMNQQLNSDQVMENVEDQISYENVVEYTNVSSNILPIEQVDQNAQTKESEETQQVQQIAVNDALEEVVQEQLQEKEAISYLNLEDPKVIVQANCIIIYSQCQFKGEAMEVCDSLDQLEQFHHQILSLYVPEGQGLTIYEKENFEGKRQHFTQSQLCLKSGFQFIQINQIHELAKNLRIRI